jgi:hypothetical protein
MRASLRRGAAHVTTRLSERIPGYQHVRGRARGMGVGSAAVATASRPTPLKLPTRAARSAVSSMTQT